MSGTAVMEKSRLEPIMTKTIREIMDDHKIVHLLRRDLSVTASENQPSGWSQVTFTLTLSPGLLDMVSSPTQVDVPVLIVDEFGNYFSTSYKMSTSGETQTHTESVPMIDTSRLHGSADKGRTILVIADPLNQTIEQSESNNMASPYCYTIG